MTASTPLTAVPGVMTREDRLPTTRVAIAINTKSSADRTPRPRETTIGSHLGLTVSTGKNQETQTPAEIIEQASARSMTESRSSKLATLNRNPCKMFSRWSRQASAGIKPEPTRSSRLPKSTQTSCV